MGLRYVGVIGEWRSEDQTAKKGLRNRWSVRVPTGPSDRFMYKWYVDSKDEEMADELVKHLGEHYTHIDDRGKRRYFIDPVADNGRTDGATSITFPSLDEPLAKPPY